MTKRQVNSTLINEEYRATRLFLVLFYILTLSYDLFTYFLLPEFTDTRYGKLSDGLGFLVYVVDFGMLPIAIYDIKRNNPGRVKYMYFSVYTLMNIVNEILIYWGNDLPYQNGNVMELFFVLLSPIFVKERFFWLVAWGTIFKFAFVGFIIQSSRVMIPIALVIVFSIVASILLTRFRGYMNAIKDSYDHQLEGVVKGIVATLELKDPYTRGHSERVAAYSLILAQHAGKFSNEQLTSLKYACLLHDIGKVNIPDQILMKPFKLTEQEYQVIKIHPVVGAQTINGITGLESCKDVVEYHHERWDGKGYPSQLKGEEIPYFARITAIADAFDAITSSRSYRSALTAEEAYRRIVDGKGTQFDPQLIDTFIEVFPVWVEFLQGYNSSKEYLQAVQEPAAGSIGKEV